MTEQNMFTILERGDRKIKSIKKKFIALVGLTRHGKSTTYNWMLGKEMIGQQNVLGDNYITDTNDPTAAELGNYFSSVTLIPNSADLDAETSLVDMAGYCDSRNYVQIMGVSYFLKSIFKHAEAVKFIMVFDEHVWHNNALESIKDIFDNFFSMFKIDLLIPGSDIYKKVLSSISFVITRSHFPSEHLIYLANILQYLNTSECTDKKNNLMKEVIEQIIHSQRIYSFPAAKLNQRPEQCNLLQEFANKNWEFLKIKEIEKQLKNSIMSIPFEKDYALLQRHQQKDLQLTINQRISSYSQFVNILLSFINLLKFSWKEEINNLKSKNLQDNLMERIFCFDKVFESIHNFIEKTDKYHSEDLIQQVEDTQYVQPTLLQIIRPILNLYKITTEVNDTIRQQFIQSMYQYSTLYSQMADCFLPFCKSVEHKKMILRLKFILTQGFHQFANFYEIVPYYLITFKQDLKDFCIGPLIWSDSNIYIQSLINIDTELVTYFFKTIPQIDEYEQIFNQYKDTSNDYRNNVNRRFQINNKSIYIGMIKAGIYHKQNRSIQACNFLIQNLRSLRNENLVEQNSDLAQINKRYIQRYLNARYLIKLRLIEKLANILSSLNSQIYTSAKDLALQLLNRFNQIQNICEIYQSQLLEYSNNPAKQRVIYKEYADHCIRWGRYPEAKILLHKKLKLEKYNFEDRTNTIKAISNLVDINSSMQIDQLKNITKLQIRPRENDYDLQNLLFRIRNYIEQRSSRGKQKKKEGEEKMYLKTNQQIYIQEEDHCYKRPINIFSDLKFYPSLSLLDFQQFFRDKFQQQFRNTFRKIQQQVERQINKLNQLKQTKWIMRSQFVEICHSYSFLVSEITQESRKIQKCLLTLFPQHKMYLDNYDTSIHRIQIDHMQSSSQIIKQRLLQFCNSDDYQFI